MPKYYRFRATNSTRKLKKSKDKEKENSENSDSKNRDRGWVDLTLACTLAPSWYLRRTSWRESPPVTGLSRQLAAELRSSLQFTNRPIFVLKMLQSDFY